MKKNLISAIAGWKSAALLALVAMVAAVAFSGVLSTGQPAEAQVDLDAGTVDVIPGGKVNIDGASGATLIQVAVTGGTSTGTFANGETSIVCRDRTTSPVANPTATCDTEDGTGITVVFTVDEDSADGYVTLSTTQLIPVVTTDPVTSVITVTTQPKPASLAIKPAAATIAAAGDGAGAGTHNDNTDDGDNVTAITATVKNDQSPSAGMNGQVVTFQTNLGTLNCPQSDADTSVTPNLPQIDAASNVQWCQVRTSNSGTPLADGNAVVTLVGSGLEGTATVTARHATLGAQTTDVTLYGDAANLSAEADQGSVEVSGSVFVVLTVTDEAGNPVSGQTITPLAAKEVIGPSEDLGTMLVTTTRDTPIPATDAFDTAIGVGYSKDKVLDPPAGPAGNIPACGEDNTDTDGTGDGTNTETFSDEGTNDKGQCVVQVNAPADDPDTTTVNEAATRGEHTINFQISETIKDSVVITVAGPAANVEDDAPDYVDPLSDTKVTITVTDDEGVLVGETSVAIIKLAGDGLVENASTMTVNGQASFSYAAGRAGEAAFRVIAGTGPTAPRHLIVINVGEAPEEVPEGPPPTWSQELVSGPNYVSWQGDDGADPSAGAAEGVTAIWQYNTGSGTWDGYFPDAADVPGGNTLSSLGNGDVYVVIVE
ncbi:MAG: hypothetical protein F4Y97_08010 [Dehalococcoidia bacterium]|nr:hypothetical protein [Dehalococcoidia bacterium]